MAQSGKDPGPQDPASRLGVYLLIGGGVLLLVMGIYQFLPGSSSEYPSIGVADYRATAVQESQLAPDFTIPDLDGGEPISLSDFRGKIVVLNVWASWCLPCRKEAPALQVAWEDYSGRGVQFLGSNYQDDRDAARAFVTEFGITYPSVFDPSGRLAADYGFFGLPSTFVIDRSQRIRFRFTGYLTATTLRAALDDLHSEHRWRTRNRHLQDRRWRYGPKLRDGHTRLARSIGPIGVDLPPPNEVAPDPVGRADPPPGPVRI